MNEIENREKELEEEFKLLCKPLNEWLQANYHPHTKIIIEVDGAELVEGIMGTPFDVVDWNRIEAKDGQ